ncbi:RnfABCDGE type electron transport complex subunit B [Spirochaetota bacterium]
MLELILPTGSAMITMLAIGILFGLILSVAKLKLKVKKDPRIEDITEILPGANCGACGQAGCSGYAMKIVNEGEDITQCPALDPANMKKIGMIMGVEVGPVKVPLKARVHCHGGIDVTVKKFDYNGPEDCEAAHNLMGGYRVCEYGCLRFGNCVKVCSFDAIYMGDNGIPIVVLDKCTGCGKCVEACPRDIISLVADNFEVFVMCKNKEKAKIMKMGCSVGCIGCKRCEKICREVFEDNPDIDTAITVDNFLASIDYDICTGCNKCVEVCPVPVIDPVEKANVNKPKEEKAEVSL